MEESEAERQLLQLLRGRDLPEFTLRICVEDANRTAAEAGGRHLLESPVWTIAMSVPQLPGDRTTTSSTSFEQAWHRQGRWWRAPPEDATTVAGQDYRQVMGAEAIERAERQLLGTVRGDVGSEIVILVSVQAGHWVVNLRVPGIGGRGTTGDGPSFAYAWYHDWPWWHDARQEPAH